MPSSCIPRPFDNTDFNLNGLANFQPPGTFELTPAVNTQFGSVWYRRRLDLRVNFRLAFDIFLGNSDSPGADGMAFVLQNLDTGQGGTGGGLGYGGLNVVDRIRPSVAVEFDTYFNAQTDPASQSDHVAFVIDGNMAVLPPAADITDVNDLENGSFHSVILEWNPTTQDLSFELTHSDGTVYNGIKNIDLISHLASNIAYWGSTAATGGQNNRHLVRMNDNSICVVDATFPVTVGNNYHTSSGTTSLTADDYQYLCSLFANGFEHRLSQWGKFRTHCGGLYDLQQPLSAPTAFSAGQRFCLF